MKEKKIRIIESEFEFKGCTNCVHYLEPFDKCENKLCVHAIHELEDKFVPKQTPTSPQHLIDSIIDGCATLGLNIDHIIINVLCLLYDKRMDYPKDYAEYKCSIAVHVTLLSMFGKGGKIPTPYKNAIIGYLESKV